MSKEDDVWDHAYTQALLMWLHSHGYSANNIPAHRRKHVVELAREYAMAMANLAIEEWAASRMGGSMLHMVFDQESTQVLASLAAFTQLPTEEVIRNAVAVYEWIRQGLHQNKAVMITREMCPHLAPKPAKPHLTLV